MRLLVPLLLASLAGCSYDFESYTPVDGDSALGTDTSSADSSAAIDTAVTDGAAPSCTDAEARSFGGHCYFPLPAANGNSAKTACEAKGAHLVTITSASEEAFVETLRAGRDRWIGLRRPPGSSPVKASFAWVTGEAVAFEKWDSGEPSGSGECVMLRSSNSWSDQDCTRSRDVVCERE